MAKRIYPRGASNNPIIRVWLMDSSATNGSPLTGLAFNTAGLRIDVIRELDATVTSYKVDVDGNLETITTIGTYAAPTASKARFKEVDATNFPGLYEIHLAQALLGTGDASRTLQGVVRGATNLAPCPFELALVAYDSEDSVRLGMTALPNAAADGAGGLPISDAGGLDLDTLLARLDVTVGSRSTYAGGAVASVTAGVTLADAAITAAKFATDALAAAAFAAGACNKIADHMRRRTQANVEASSDGDNLDLSSLYGMIQQAQEAAISGSTLTVKKTDGITTLGTKALVSSVAADPITEIS